MKIESVDFFYLSMPVVTDAGDGSQDALVVRVRAGGIEAWGECEASPLTSIASYLTKNPFAFWLGWRHTFNVRRKADPSLRSG